MTRRKTPDGGDRKEVDWSVPGGKPGDGSAHGTLTAEIKRPSAVEQEIGARIRALRQAGGVSMENLAAALGVSYQQVQKYERGTNRISAGRLQRIAQRLGVTPADLYGRDPSVAPIAAGPDRDKNELQRLFAQLRSAERRGRVLAAVQAMVDEENIETQAD